MQVAAGSRRWMVALTTSLLLLIATGISLMLAHTGTTVLAAEGWNGVPRLAPDYSQDVESWWADHPFNPESPGYAPSIVSPSYLVDVQAEHDGNVQAAIDALPADGGTLYFPAGIYDGSFRLIGKSHVHFVGEPGSIIRSPDSHTMAGCELAADYGAFSVKVHSRSSEALDCATRGRLQDVYVKGLTFDGAGSSLQAIRISAAQDVVFDDVTFQNFVDPNDRHRGLVSGNAVIENIWFRDSRFVGRERYALYLDGLHGGGVINSTIENGFSAGGLLFLTNDDFSRDYNADGQVELSEQRSSQYVVVYGNRFAGGTHDVVSATGRQILIAKNTVTEPVVSLVTFDAKSSHVDRRVVYEYTGNRVVGNRVRAVRELVHVSAPPNCPLSVNCARAGQYEVRNNIVETSSTFRGVSTERPTTVAPIDGPNVESENCVADPVCQ